VVSPDDVRRRAHRLGLLVGAAGVVLWSMYLIAPDGSPLRSLRRDLSADRWLIVYLAASLVALTIALAESGANARRYAKDSAGPLRHGLRLLALGCAFGLCYVAIKVAATGAASFGYVRVGQAFDAWLGRSAAVLAGIATAVGCLTPVLAKAWRYGSEALGRTWPTCGSTRCGRPPSPRSLTWHSSRRSVAFATSLTCVSRKCACTDGSSSYEMRSSPSLRSETLTMTAPRR
jgi:hypothetical protein